MEAVGAGALEKTSMALKSVWVDSVEVGPRSVVGGREAERGVRVVERVRVWWRAEVGWGGCVVWWVVGGLGDERRFGRCGGWRRGRVERIVSVALRARRRGMLGAGIVGFLVRWSGFSFTLEYRNSRDVLGHEAIER